ncbi:MAG: crossover junction endodeoxyribonuclease RuvC [Promethearchaeota archaeon]|jgi:crossover junction endodeoxyribonuclease RuvC
MIYIGIDPSYSSTGFIILDENGEIQRQEILKFNKKGTDTEWRLIQVKKRLIDPVINMHDRDIIKVCMEGPSYSSRGSHVLQMGALNFFIRYWFRAAGVDYTVRTPNELKKFVTGKGNCKKDLILLKVYKRWKVEFESDDLADAYGLARYILEESNK